MRGMAVFIVLTMTASAVAGDDDSQPSVGKVAKRAVSPVAVARSAAGAAINQGLNIPHEWGQGAEGYSRRVGSSFGAHLVKIGIQYPLARLFHEEFGYQRSNKTGFKARFFYALEATVITHKTTTEQATVSKSEIGGAVGAGLISRVWEPASERAIFHGFIAAGTMMGADAGGNVLREFWPEISRKFHHKHQPSAAIPAAGQRE